MSEQTAFAGFWKRVAASFIDSIVTNVLFLPVPYLIGSFDTAAGGMQLPTDTMLSPAAYLIFLVGVIVVWLYYPILESSTLQGTLGKRALGIVVTDLDGRRIGFGRANGRYFAKFISGIILGIGFLMVAFTEKKQGLHDQIAGTLVVNRG